MLRNGTTIIWIASLLTTITMSGCDDAVTRVAREAADRQAQQNKTMAELHKEVASGTERLVEADAQARKEIVGVHHDLQTERARLDTGWNTLNEERRQIAGQRRTESLLSLGAAVTTQLLVVIMLLGFCWCLLVASYRSDDTSAQLNDVLIGGVLIDEIPHAALEQSRRTVFTSRTGAEDLGA